MNPNEKISPKLKLTPTSMYFAGTTLVAIATAGLTTWASGLLVLGLGCMGYAIVYAIHHM